MNNDPLKLTRALQARQTDWRRAAFVFVLASIVSGVYLKLMSSVAFGAIVRGRILI